MACFASRLISVLFVTFFASFAEVGCYIVQNPITGKIYTTKNAPDFSVMLLGKSENSPEDLIKNFGDVSKIKDIESKFVEAFITYSLELITLQNRDSSYFKSLIEVTDEEWYDGNIFEIGHAYPCMAYHIIFNGKKWFYEAMEQSTIAVDIEKERLIIAWFIAIFIFYIVVGMKKKIFSGLGDKEFNKFVGFLLFVGTGLALVFTIYATFGWSFDTYPNNVKFAITMIFFNIMLNFFGRSFLSLIIINFAPAFMVWKILGIGNMLMFLGISLVISAIAILLHNLIQNIIQNRKEKIQISDQV